MEGNIDTLNHLITSGNIGTVLDELAAWRAANTSVIIDKQIFRLVSEHSMCEPNPKCTMNYTILITYKKHTTIHATDNI